MKGPYRFTLRSFLSALVLGLGLVAFGAATTFADPGGPPDEETEDPGGPPVMEPQPDPEWAP